MVNFLRVSLVDKKMKKPYESRDGKIMKIGKAFLLASGMVGASGMAGTEAEAFFLGRH